MTTWRAIPMRLHEAPSDPVWLLPIAVLNPGGWCLWGQIPEWSKCKVPVHSCSARSSGPLSAMMQHWTPKTPNPLCVWLGIWPHLCLKHRVLQLLQLFRRPQQQDVILLRQVLQVHLEFAARPRQHLAQQEQRQGSCLQGVSQMWWCGVLSVWLLSQHSRES